MPAQKREALEYRYYDLPDELPLLVLSGEHWRISQRPSSRLHFHGCTELGICHSWHGTLQLGDKRLPFGRGDLTLIPPYLPHTTWSDPGENSRWSYVFFALGPLFAQPPALGRPHPLFAPNESCCLFHTHQAAGLYALACDIVREWERQEQDHQACSLGLLQALTIKLARLQHSGLCEASAAGEAGARPPEMLAVLPALDYLEQNYSEPVSIAQLAQLCRLSETHFRRCFKAVFGLAPLAYLNRLRVQKACSMLRRSNASVLCISERAGFATLSSFNRHFKRQTGLAPLAWRRAQARQPRSAIIQRSGWVSPEDPPG